MYKFQISSKKSLFAQQFAQSKEKDFGILMGPHLGNKPALIGNDIDDDLMEDGNC